MPGLFWLQSVFSLQANPFVSRHLEPTRASLPI